MIRTDTPREEKSLKWLITGGCGFIGTRLIKNLIDVGGNTIRVLDNLIVGTRNDLAGVCTYEEIPPDNLDAPSLPVQLIVGDVQDETLTVNTSYDVDIIVHLAANTGVEPSVENPRADCMANVIGTLNCLEAARINGIKRFIFASSGAPVGDVDPPIHEELAPHPLSPYGASKLAGEGYCSAYYRTFGVECVALRFGNVYGPGALQKNSVVAKFIKQALRGEALEIYGDGTQTRDFIYIDDLVAAIRQAADREGVGGEIFQIASNAETTIDEMAGLLVKKMAEYGIENIRIFHGQPRLGDVKRNYSDTAKARRLLGWTPQFNLSQGISRTVDYFIQKGT